MLLLCRSVVLAACLAVLPAHAAKSKSPPFTDRAEVQEFIAEMVLNHDFDRDALHALLSSLTPVPKAIALIKPPADPGVRSWQRYRSRFIEPKRIAAGQRFMARYGDELARAEARYGVPREIIGGIIGVETIYGKNTGDFNTLATLTTLAFDYPPRADLFRKELRELLLLARSEQRSPRSYEGSFAGALGLPQFLPSSIRAYGVDFDGDGHIDLQKSAVDAIGSVANYLAVHGWQREQPVATTVIATGADAAIFAALAEGISPRRNADEWRAQGVELRQVGAGGTALDLPGALRSLPAALIDLVTPEQATEYRLGYQNFYAITRYNKSTFYASAVMDLAQALSPEMK